MRWRMLNKGTMGFQGYEQELPQYVVEDIVNLVEDASDVAKALCVCRDWRDAGDNVRSLRIVALNATYSTRIRNAFLCIIQSFTTIEPTMYSALVSSRPFSDISITYSGFAAGVRRLESIVARFQLDAVSASGLEPTFSVLVSAVFLSIVYQYLIGYVDRGGTKTYNSGSLEFGATYVSLLLFQGAYVWIKSRDVAPKRTVYRRSRKDEFGGFQYYGKYEPRFKPPREKDGVTGTNLKFAILPLGGYDTHHDAEVVCQIAGFYYGKDADIVKLDDGFDFSIPPMSEQERSLCGEEKRKWVGGKAKKVYKEISVSQNQYFIGYVDRGGTKTYNSGSLEFGATYVSLLLFQGAYVWIKSRDVAPKRTVYRRSRKDEFGGFQYYGKYEPRFKPPREKDGVTGTNLKFAILPLGGYDTHHDAEVVCQIAGFYYGKDADIVKLDDGFDFSIPPMSEQECSLCGEEKRKWVSERAKEVYKEMNNERATRRQARSNTLGANAGEQDDAHDFSPSADAAVAFLAATANSDDEFANFLLEPADFYGPLMSFDSENLLDVDDIVDFLQEGSEGIAPLEESLAQQLNLQKGQLEAEFNRRIAERHQQHVQIQQRLEAENLELRRENEHMKSIIHQVLKPLRSHFETSTEI